EQRPGLQRKPAPLVDVPEAAAVVEADQLAVVLVLGDLDVLGLEHLVKGVEVKRLAVDDHAVEIEQDRARPGAWPGGHGQQASGGGPARQWPAFRVGVAAMRQKKTGDRSPCRRSPDRRR